MLELNEVIDLVNKAIQKLPISYYTKAAAQKITTTCNGTSYFDGSNQEICISYTNIADYIEKLEKKLKRTLTPEEQEKTIRGQLYHETSHAILTPAYHSGLRSYNYGIKEERKISAEVVNIIEDERIETLFKNYYLNVNFKEQIKLLVSLKKTLKAAPKKFEAYLFAVTRLDYLGTTKKERETIKKARHDFFIRTRKITRNCSWLDIDIYLNAVSQYKYTIYQLWQYIYPQPQQQQPQKDGNQTEKEDGKDGNQNNPQTSEENNNENTDNNEENKDDNSTTETEEETNQSEEGEETEEGYKGNKTETENGTEDEEKTEDEEDEKELTEEELQDAINNAMQDLQKAAAYYGKLKLSDTIPNDDFKLKVANLIMRKTGCGTSKTPTNYGYSGKFSAKKYCSDYNETCRWFEKKAQTGKAARQSKEKILNIFLDNSGSFCNNDYEVNRLMKTLQDLEGKNKGFKFNLVTIKNTLQEKKGDERLSCSSGGTDIKEDELKALIQNNRDYTKSNAVNIILFDGLINTMDIYNLAQFFNNNKTIVITECSNEDNFKRLFTSAKKIIVENSNYAKRLAENVYSALDVLYSL